MEASPAARPLAPFHALILALCRETRRFPATDPVELATTPRGAALDAAEAVQIACAACSALTAGAPQAFAGSATAAIDSRPALALALAERRLRELSFCIEVARRLGYLSECGAAQVLPLLDRAHREVPRLATLSGGRRSAATPLH